MSWLIPTQMELEYLQVPRTEEIKLDNLSWLIRILQNYMCLIKLKKNNINQKVSTFSYAVVGSSRREIKKKKNDMCLNKQKKPSYNAPNDLAFLCRYNSL